MIILDEPTASALIVPHAIVASVEAAFRQLASGAARQPAQLQVSLPADDGDTIYYSAITAMPPLIGVTVSPFIAARIGKGLAPVTAYTLLLSGETGEAIAAIDSKTLIAARTGATTCIATRRLARRLDRVAIIGSGQIAEWHLRCLADVPCDAITMFSPSLLAADRRKRKDDLQSLDSRLKCVSTLDAAVERAGVIMLCTASPTPVLDVELTCEDALITSVTTDGPDAHEIDPRQLASLNVYCDYRQTAPMVAGDMRLAAVLHSWQPAAILADLPELITNPCDAPLPLTGRRFFRSVGLGIEDVAAAAAVLGTPCT